MDKQKLLRLILGIETCPKRKSTLQLALEKARHSCGYTPDNLFDDIHFGFRQHRHAILEAGLEECLCSDEADLFVALFLYLNILEQFGVMFSGNKHGIKKAIENFSSNNDGEILQKLRHSLAHSFGLVNVNMILNYKPTDKFILSFSDGQGIIASKPKCKWDGDYSDKSEETSTTIFVYDFIRLAESIIKTAQERAKANNLQFALDTNEIESRFTIVIT